MAQRGDWQGQSLGNYRLLQVLGWGHWAAVYLGEHQHLHSQAAIKVLHDPLAPALVDGFLGEARTLARLRHPHIVRLLDFGLQEDIPFLVLDYAPGGTLRTLHPKGTRLPLSTVVSYVKQVASALQYAHEQRLLHRDLKPENVLLGPEQQLWLADFGLAIVMQSAGTQPLQQTAGTLAYVAPEQLKGQPTAASDQYALGILVYEWLGGEPPFSGSFPELAVQHTLVPPPSLTKKVPTLPVGVEHVVLTALAKDPKLRFASVEAFALAFEEACQAETSSGQTVFLPSSHSPGPSAPATRHTLPTQLTPLIGRDQEVAAISTLLRRPEVRLVTLSGTGGIGKTRLALQVGTEMLADFPDGVFFVSLAPLSDPALVISTIAHSLGLTESGSQPMLDQLKLALRDKQRLLLLDNFEHVIEASTLLVELLEACPHLKILVTSREVLHLRAEHQFAVPPLVLPDPGHLPDAGSLAHVPAVHLFLQRAQAICSDFELTADNAATIAEICLRLDGLPLAIELAAARVKVLSVQALSRRLEHRFQLLTGGARDLPERQRTLRTTIQWSYDLLSKEEQLLFRRLSVFVGGSTLEAVEAVCSMLGDGDISVLEGVTSLLDKSLLQHMEQRQGEPHLMMLEILREYGLEALAANEEMEATRQAYAHYYLGLAEEAEPELGGPQQVEWLERLERAYDNLRAALLWYLERGKVGHNIEMALRLAGALLKFWEVRGHWSEGRDFLERALSESTGVVAAVQVKALKAAAHLAYRQGDADRGETLSKECLTRCRELGDTAGVALSLRLLGLVAWLRGNFVLACSRTEESLVLFREVGDKEGTAWALFNLAVLIDHQGEYARAISLTEESLALFREGGDKEGIAWALLELANLHFCFQGDPAKVHTLIAEGLALCKEIGHKEGVNWALSLLVEVFLQEGNAVNARLLLEEAMALSREYRHATAEALFQLGKVLALEGDLAAAHAHYEESLARGRETGDDLNIPSYLEGLADVVAAQGKSFWAAQLWGTADTLRKAMGMPIPPVYRAGYERAVATARAQLGEQAFATAWAEGRTMTLEHVLDGARRLSPSPISSRLADATEPGAPVHSPEPAPLVSATLTPREKEVLRLLAQGLTSAQIAEQLVIGVVTVNFHVRSIYSKLGVTSRAAATRYALDHYLV